MRRRKTGGLQSVLENYNVVLDESGSTKRSYMLYKVRRPPSFPPPTSPPPTFFPLSTPTCVQTHPCSYVHLIHLDYFPYSTITPSIPAATTPQELLFLVNEIEHAIPRVLKFVLSEEALPSAADTCAALATRVFVLDRLVRYDEIKDVEKQVR